MLRVEGRLEHGAEAAIIRLGDRVVAMVVALRQATVMPSTAEPTILMVSATTWFEKSGSPAESVGGKTEEGSALRENIASWGIPWSRWSYHASSKPGVPQDAYPDDPQSRREVQVIRLRRARLEEEADGPALVVQVRPRKNGRPYCSGCGRPGPAYDRLEERRFEFVPFWGILVFLAYRMRRVNCKRCGVTVEMVPWCDGKNQLTTTYRWFLSTWAKRLSWSEVAAIFRTSWDSVCRAVEHAVEWGLAHRDLSELTALGIDEIAWNRGHRYLTLVYDIGGETRRLLAVAEERTEASLRSCLEGLGEPACKQVQFVCSDMWKPYLKVIGEKLGDAIHVLDRFHIMQKFGKAIDEIRAEEAKRLERDGYEPVLKRRGGAF